MAGHQTKCKVWVARAAPADYTHIVHGVLAIHHPPSWAYSHSKEDPDPEWLVTAKQKVDPIRDARAAEMQAKQKAGQYELAAAFEKQTAEIEKQAGEEQAAKQAEAAQKA